MRLFQIGYKVNDIHRTIAAYRDLFGFEWEEVKTYDLPESGARARTRSLVSHARLEGGVELELVETVDGVTADVELLGDGEGISHIGLMVDDLEAAKAQMTARGARIAHEGEAARAVWAFVIDGRLGGAMVQLVQMRDETAS